MHYVSTSTFSTYNIRGAKDMQTLQQKHWKTGSETAILPYQLKKRLYICTILIDIGKYISIPK